MSKQYKKLIKRRRRVAYLARRKKALTEASSKKVSTKQTSVKKASKTVPKKPVAKDEVLSVAAEVKASNKATQADVLGPDADVSKSSSEE